MRKKRQVRKHHVKFSVFLKVKTQNNKVNESQDKGVVVPNPFRSNRQDSIELDKEMIQF